MFYRSYIYTFILLYTLCVVNLSHASSPESVEPVLKKPAVAVDIKQLTYAELCAGKGLVTRSFMARGYRPIILNDIDGHSLQLCKKNTQTNENPPAYIEGDITLETIQQQFIKEGLVRLNQKDLDVLYVFLHENTFLGILQGAAEIAKALRPKTIIIQILKITKYTSDLVEGLKNKTYQRSPLIDQIYRQVKTKNDKVQNTLPLKEKTFKTVLSHYMGESYDYEDYETSLTEEDVGSPLCNKIALCILTRTGVPIPARFLHPTNTAAISIRQALESSANYIKDITRKDCPRNWWDTLLADGSFHPLHQTITWLDSNGQHVMDYMPIPTERNSKKFGHGKSIGINIFSPAVVEKHKDCRSCLGQLINALPKDIYARSRRQFNRALVDGPERRLTRDALDCATYVHPTQPRAYTPLEIFSLYGFLKLGPCLITDNRPKYINVDKYLEGELLQITPIWYTLHIAEKMSIYLLSEVTALHQDYVFSPRALSYFDKGLAPFAIADTIPKMKKARVFYEKQFKTWKNKESSSNKEEKAEREGKKRNREESDMQSDLHPAPNQDVQTLFIEEPKEKKRKELPQPKTVNELLALAPEILAPNTAIEEKDWYIGLLLEQVKP